MEINQLKERSKHEIGIAHEKSEMESQQQRA